MSTAYQSRAALDTASMMPDRVQQQYRCNMISLAHRNLARRSVQQRAKAEADSLGDISWVRILHNAWGA